MKISLRLLFLLITSLVVSAQVGTWDKIPTLTEVRTLLPIANEVIMASDGGVLLFNKASGLFSYGIQNKVTDNLDINTTLIDSDNLLWLGSRSPGPIVEVMDLNTNNFLDVEFVDLDAITSFVQAGDSVYATYQDGLEGGLLLYRKGLGSIEYLDLFNNFPDQSSLNMEYLSDAGVVNGNLYFRTNHEIIWIELDGRNLKDPTNWKVALVPAPGSEISRVTSYQNRIRIAAGSSIYEYDFDQFTTLFAGGNQISDMANKPNDGNVIILATSLGVASLDISNSTISLIHELTHIQNIELYNDEIWIASTTEFLSLYQDQTHVSYTANRSRDHLFNRMLVDVSGQLVGGAKNGFSLYSSSGWRTIKAGNFNSDFDESSYNWNEMITGTLDFQGSSVIEDMVMDGAGNIFFSIQGKGIFRLDDEQPGNSRFYSAADGSMEPTYDSDTYVLCGQMAVDSKQNVWATTKFVREGGHAVSILSPNDSVFHISQHQNGLNTRTVKSIAIDDHDMVWLGSQVRTELQASGGIHLVEILGGELSSDMELNVSSLSSSDTPLASNEILQLEVDTHNTLWILTPAGVQSMPLPDKWLTSSELRNHANLYMTPKESDYYYYWQLTDYNVTGIEIDQRGNHWFLSANAGVHVLQDNGRWINAGFGYNTGNSGLLDNEIHSVAFDAETGQTYLSTSKGISVLKTPFANPKETYSSIHIYPQPFNPDIHDKVIIQGLMDNSSVRILTIQGALVRELTYLNNNVQGYEAQWDGRDAAGDKVGSGVYILYLFNDEGAAASQKVAVLR